MQLVLEGSHRANLPRLAPWPHAEHSSSERTGHGDRRLVTRRASSARAAPGRGPRLGTWERSGPGPAPFRPAPAAAADPSRGLGSRVDGPQPRPCRLHRRPPVLRRRDSAAGRDLVYSPPPVPGRLRPRQQRLLHATPAELTWLCHGRSRPPAAARICHGARPPVPSTAVGWTRPDPPSYDAYLRGRNDHA